MTRSAVPSPRTPGRRGLCLAAGALFAGALLGACGGDERAAQRDFSPQLEALEQAGRFGFVTVVVRADPGPQGTVRLNTRAHFVAHEGLARDETLAMLGLPPLLRLAPAGHCEVVRQRLDAFRPGAVGDAWIELLDAGDIGVLAGARSVLLDSRSFPDVLPFMSGLTYEGVTRIPAAPGEPLVTLSATGGGDVGRFEVTLRAPPSFRFTALAGQSLPSSAPPRIPWGADVDVRWAGQGPPSEPVILELSRRTFDAVHAVRCVVPDAGQFAIPGRLLAELPALDEPTTDRLSGRRIRATDFYAAGLDEAWAFAISEDSVLLP